MPRVKTDDKVELRKILRPTGLLTSQYLGCREVFKVFVISDNIHWSWRSLQIMAPNSESLENGNTARRGLFCSMQNLCRMYCKNIKFCIWKNLCIILIFATCRILIITIYIIVIIRILHAAKFKILHKFCQVQNLMFLQYILHEFCMLQNNPFPAVQAIPCHECHSSILEH